MRWFPPSTCPARTTRTTLRVTALLAADCDEGLAYGARLREAGTEVTLPLHGGQVYGLAELTTASPSARAATIEACRWLCRR